MSRIIDIMKGSYTGIPYSRDESILLGDSTITPRTRVEEYYKALVNNTPCSLIPRTRIEELIDSIVNNRIYSVISTDRFTSRTTAEGTDIIDGAKAEILSIEGDTVKCDNLFNGNTDISDTTKYVFNGEEDTITSNAAGGSTLINSDKFIGSLFVSIILYSKPTTASSFTFYDNSTALTNGFENIQGYNLNQIYTINVSISTLLKIRLWGNSNIETFKFRMWINIDSAKDYQPFFTGLKNSKVTSLVSKNSSGKVIDNINPNIEVGKWQKIWKATNWLNIADKAETTINGITYKVENGAITFNGTPNTNFSLTFNNNNLVKINGSVFVNWFNDTFRYNGSVYNDLFISSNGTLTKIDKNMGDTTIINNYVIGSFVIFFRVGRTYTNEIIKPMIVEGTTAPTTFLPYTDKNYIEDKQGETIIFDGSETGWEYSSVYNYFYIQLTNAYLYSSALTAISNIKVVPYDNRSDDMINILCDINPSNGTLQLRNTGLNSINALKTFLGSNNLTIRYQTSTHTYIPLNINLSYTAASAGTETIVNDNDQYGSIATTEIEYMYSSTPFDGFRDELEKTIVDCYGGR